MKLGETLHKNCATVEGEKYYRRKKREKINLLGEIVVFVFIVWKYMKQKMGRFKREEKKAHHFFPCFFFTTVETGGEKKSLFGNSFYLFFLGFAIMHAYFEIRRRVCRKKDKKIHQKKAKKYRLSLKEWGHFRILRNKKIREREKNTSNNN